MRPLLVSATLLLAGLAPVATGPTAHAAAACQGRPATFEATDGTVTGTPGPDVVVVGGSVTQVDTGDGADLVCLVGGTGPVRIDTGPGNDVVDTTAATSTSTTQLGPGADTFTGGVREDQVDAGPDAGPDLVSTGDGADSLTVLAGAVRADLGAGNDELVYGISAVGRQVSRIAMGTGRDEVYVEHPRSVRVDLRRHRLQILNVRTDLRQAEDVYATAPRVVLRGDGDDNALYGAGCHVSLHGGAGKDRLAQWPGDAPCRARHARMHGDAGPDRLQGWDGDDVLVGGGGADELRGLAGDDVLLGGGDRDTAVGGRGRDRCVAEREQACDR